MVRVTDVPGIPTPRATPRAKATAFVAPHHPYIQLQPATGPPVSHSVHLVGGNLPRRVPVDILWSPRGRRSSIDTVIYTGPRGNIGVSYTVPMSPPGTYTVTAQVNGVAYASTHYHVVSRATLDVMVSLAGNGDALVISGRHFISHFRLALVAYRASGAGKPIVLGMVRASARGSFVFRRTTTRLAPGQYILRSWSVSDLAAQMAETVFEVTI